MSSHSLGILIGGIIPAVLFGIANIFVKGSNNVGIGAGPYLVILGLSVALVGLIFFILVPDKTLSMRSGLFAMGFGLTWGTGVGLVAIALTRYHSPISVLAPLFNMNTLVTVILALWIFAEWKQVHVPRLLIGSALIVAGGVLVAR